MDTRLTPRELFEFYAKIRYNKDEDPNFPSDPQKAAEEMINILSLNKCADTIVGDAFHRGISGGEKKRTSIGIELISNPNLLFLDEPTTGLDSTTAYSVMKTMKDLKNRGITIISTIHSPSDAILRLFDQIIILCDGKLVYDGKPDDITQYLQEINFPPKKNIPPLEFFMQVIDKDDLRLELAKERHVDSTEDSDQFESELNERFDKRIKVFQDHQVEKTST